VLVPARFAANRRRPIALIATWLAVWLVVLQAFLAGVVAAQAGARLAAIPGDIICHASGDAAGQADGSVPDSGNGWHLCCAACTAPALATPATPALAAMELPQALQRLTLPGLTIVVARGAIRAGPSRGPPTLG
jgi:hypothetical protein